MIRLNPSMFLVALFCFMARYSPAQELSPCSNVRQHFARAMDHLDAFSNDSANVILTGLIEQLSAEGTLHTPFGLEVRLRQAEVLEKDEKDELAIEKLLVIVEDGRQQKHWEVQANAHLSLARLHEKMNLPKRCRQNLQAARSIVMHQSLDSIYPRLCIRWASYHRIFTKNIDSALVYAREVVRTAPELGLRDHEGTGQMLLGMLLAKKDYDKSAVHYVKASTIFQSLGNFCGYAFMLGNLSKLHLQNGHAELALTYNDSFLVAGQQAISNGYDSTIVMSYYHKGRAAVFEKMNAFDSTVYHLKAFHQLELESLQQSNLEKVVAIEARYHDEKKVQKIEEQEQLIYYEKARRNGLLGLVFLVLIFAMILAYLYRKLQLANRKTNRQAMTIQKANEELSISLEQEMILQGEIHHRVKNNLQVIISLLDLQRDDISDPKALESLNSMSNRIYSMAAIHEMLYHRQGIERVNLLEYTRNLCQHLQEFSDINHEIDFQLNLPNKFFNLETLTPLGIILNELMTNSLKYATIPAQPLVIRIGLQPMEKGFCLHYRDNGPGFCRGTLEEREGGLGTYLLKSMSRQLNGHLQSCNDQGASYSIYFQEKNKSKVYETVSDFDY